MLELTFVSEEVGESSRVFLVPSLLADASYDCYNETGTDDSSSDDSELDLVLVAWIESTVVVIIIILWTNWNDL